MTSPEQSLMNVLGLVRELHGAGYELLRIAPGMAPSGCYWRCAITPKSNIRRSHGAMLKDFDGLVARYTSGQGREYFGWKDAQADDATALAHKFSQRFPAILNHSRGNDPAYVAWYVRMLEYAERGKLPIAYADWYEPTDPRFMPLLGCISDLPMPPPGGAEEVAAH